MTVYFFAGNCRDRHALVLKITIAAIYRGDAPPIRPAPIYHQSNWEHRMNFSDLAKMKDMMGQAQQMQEQMERKLSESVIEASSGGGVVTARMNGKKELLKLTIDPSVMGSSSSNDIELLEDLITAAVNECGRRADEAMKSDVQGMMGNMMGGLNLPGLT
jgi:nucleoid-associated protein EbfC